MGTAHELLLPQHGGMPRCVTIVWHILHVQSTGAELFTADKVGKMLCPDARVDDIASRRLSLQLSERRRRL